MGKDYSRFVMRFEDITITDCATCKHNHGDVTCDAFPDGIPDVLLKPEGRHREPIDGDHGIQYEPIENEE